MDLTKTELFVGTGGIGSGMCFSLRGLHTLGRDESRGGELHDWRDYCKLHIVFHNLARLIDPQRTGRVKILPIGKVGRDETGRSLCQSMSAAGLDLTYVETAENKPTLFSVCFVYPDSTGGNITSLNSASSEVGPQDIDRVKDVLAKFVGRGVAVALPEVPLPARGRLLQLTREYGFFRAATFTADEMAEVRDSDLLKDVDLLALNVDEARALANQGPERTPEDGGGGFPAGIDHRCLDTALRLNPAMMVCITAGPLGSWGSYRGSSEYYPGLAVAVRNTAGAGDAYLAGVLTGLANGLPFIAVPPRARGSLAEGKIETACDYGTAVAALSVTSPHAIHPDLDAAMVEKYLAGLRTIRTQTASYPAGGPLDPAAPSGSPPRLG